MLGGLPAASTPPRGIRPQRADARADRSLTHGVGLGQPGGGHRCVRVERGQLHLEARDQLARNLGEGRQLTGIEPQPHRFDGSAALRAQRVERATAERSERVRPVASVTAVRLRSISALLAASTATPGRIAPDASLTTPVIEACANARWGTSTAMASSGAEAGFNIVRLLAAIVQLETIRHPRTQGQAVRLKPVLGGDHRNGFRLRPVGRGDRQSSDAERDPRYCTPHDHGRPSAVSRNRSATATCIAIPSARADSLTRILGE